MPVLEGSSAPPHIFNVTTSTTTVTESSGNAYAVLPPFGWTHIIAFILAVATIVLAGIVYEYKHGKLSPCEELDLKMLLLDGSRTRLLRQHMDWYYFLSRGIITLSEFRSLSTAFLQMMIKIDGVTIAIINEKLRLLVAKSMFEISVLEGWGRPTLIKNLNNEWNHTR